ncbi:MAG: hypothetical protein IBJ15_01075, partial [Alphaproteobacteria bacterium]|nr:hypothetical protein [Alphaproteobacteria bacterium]
MTTRTPTAGDDAPADPNRPTPGAIFAKIAADLAQKRRQAAAEGRAVGSPAEIAARNQRFTGLPDGVGHARELLAPLRELGKALPFKRAALVTLEVLVDLVPTARWAAGDDAQRPIAVITNYKLAARLGVDERTVQFHLGWLEKGGALIRMGDASGKRTRRIADDGSEIRLGLDLTPLVALYLESKPLVVRARAHRNKMMDLRRLLNASVLKAARLRDSAGMLLTAAHDHVESAGLAGEPAWLRTVTASGEEAVALARELESYAALADAQMNADARSAPADWGANETALQSLVGGADARIAEADALYLTALAALPEAAWAPQSDPQADRAIEALDRGLQMVRSEASRMNQDSPMGESGFVQTPTPRLPPAIAGYGGGPLTIKLTEDVRRPLHDRQGALALNGEGGETTADDPKPRGPGIEIAVSTLLQMGGKLPGLMREICGVDPSKAGANDLLDLGRFIAISEFGASQRLWNDQCQQHRPGIVALAALLTYVKPDENLRKGSKLSYWLGILRKPPAELNLAPSIFAAIRRGRPLVDA